MIVAIEGVEIDFKKAATTSLLCFQIKGALLTLTSRLDKFKEVITCPQIYRKVSNAHIIPFKN